MHVVADLEAVGVADRALDRQDPRAVALGNTDVRQVVVPTRTRTGTDPQPRRPASPSSRSIGLRSVGRLTKVQSARRASHAQRGAVKSRGRSSVITRP
ncbi:hypothetical protein BC477_10040 [Clavibacter michiganensis subsp. michiganensis]|uniref:Uncharacterized protein n=1 Tax=Clavibacter michiganensis subsp. michiganensis TaxID=33013 RepID=A0A251XNN2_CLAMM|nr:hypothetical protein BC477_10040 [Clavibacter michiganensis subsp. michiganensis]OUE05067.1 hypothetical protein CMMCAS07_08960 [Clavibacter michiganensis subsp. michiganensis]